MNIEQKIHYTFICDTTGIEALSAINESAVALALECNPAMLVLLSDCTQFGYLWTLEDLLYDLESNPKRLLECLGYSGASLGLLAKIRAPQLLNIRYLSLLLKMSLNPVLLRNMRHLAAITSEVIMLGHAKPDLCIQEPGLLHLAAQVPEDSEDVVFESVCAIYSAHVLLGEPGWPYRNVEYSRDWLLRCRAELDRRLIKAGEELDIPYPLVSKASGKYWHCITSVAELDEAAEFFNNCVMLYHYYLLSGLAELYINRVEFDQPCCCLVFISGNKRWIKEIGIPDNAPLPKLIEFKVRDHFLLHGLISSAD